MSAPVSPLRSARTAEASRTTLSPRFTGCLGAPFRQEFFHEAAPRGNELPHHLLSLFDSLFHSKEPQGAVFKNEDKVISFLDALRFSELGGNDNAATFAKFCL